MGFIKTPAIVDLFVSDFKSRFSGVLCLSAPSTTVCIIAFLPFSVLKLSVNARHNSRNKNERRAYTPGAD